MQTSVEVGDDEITGTLKYVSDYTGFSGDPDLQKGNFLALKCDSDEGATITVELVGGHSGAVTLDDDKNIVIRIENKATQSVKVVASKDGDSITKTFGLTGLTLEEDDD